MILYSYYLSFVHKPIDNYRTRTLRRVYDNIVLFTTDFGARTLSGVTRAQQSIRTTAAHW